MSIEQHIRHFTHWPTQLERAKRSAIPLCHWTKTKGKGGRNSKANNSTKHVIETSLHIQAKESRRKGSPLVETKSHQVESFANLHNMVINLRRNKTFTQETKCKRSFSNVSTKLHKAIPSLVSRTKPHGRFIAMEIKTGSRKDEGENTFISEE